MNTRAIPKDRAEAFGLLLRHWRLVAVSAAAQIVGGFVFMLSVRPEADPFLDFWLGAATAGPIGLLGGLVWHLADQRRRRATHWLFVGFLLLCALLVPVLGWPAVRQI